MTVRRPLWNADRFDTDDGEVEAALVPLAEALRAALAPVPPPDARRMRAHRAAFLAVAQPPNRRWRPRWGQGVAPQGAWLAAVVFVALLCTIGISARSLPGDTLFPVKVGLEQLAFAFRDDGAWQQQLDARRRAEVLALVHAGRDAAVDFEGTLQQGADGAWRVGGVALALSAEQQRVVRYACQGVPVRVQGLVAGGELRLLALTPRCLTLDPRDRSAGHSAPAPLILPAPPHDPPGAGPAAPGRVAWEPRRPGS